MDLTKQPPRRPSNIGMAGLVGLARMADKARAYRDETLGDYKYGESSGLDRDVLEFIGLGANEFAEFAARLGDDGLENKVKERLQGSTQEIAVFNDENLRRVPQDDLHRKLLEERVAKYVSGSTEITTVLQSMELDRLGDLPRQRSYSETSSDPVSALRYWGRNPRTHVGQGSSGDRWQARELQIRQELRPRSQGHGISRNRNRGVH